MQSGDDMIIHNNAGLLRRVGAIIIDVGVLMLLGLALGLVFGDQFVRLGALGPLVGFVIAGCYYGILNSRLGNGQTLGKRFCSIQVKRKDGTMLSPGASLARFAIFGVAVFMPPPNTTEMGLIMLLATLVSCLANGMAAADVYLFLFNRATRQSLHDLALGTYVVHAGSAVEQETPRLWRGHVIACAAVAALTLATTVSVLVMALRADTQPPANREWEQTKQQIAALVEVRALSIVVGTETMLWAASAQPADTPKERPLVIAKIELGENRIYDQALAEKIAQTIWANPTYAGRAIRLSLSYGYHVGIARSSSARTFNFKPPAP
jgi:uncharacterized RDD family membrane protein YckC